MISKEWLAQTRGRQNQFFGVDYRRMQVNVEYRMAYLKEQLFGAMVELGEAANEVPWKSWTKGDRAELYAATRDKAVGEMVDVLFFIANALTALDVSDDEIRSKYDLKWAVNQARQENPDYDGFARKCASCRRALDEPGAPAPIRANERLYCSYGCVTKRETV